MDSVYEVILDGGGPWGIRLQGGKDFGLPLNIARVTPGSKAANKRLISGDIITSINGVETDSMTHMDAQNAFKAAGDRLHLMLRSGTGMSASAAQDIGAGGFAATPKTMYTTETVHSAGSDYKFNAKPRAFPGGESGSGSASGTTSPQRVEATSAVKFDPAEYARKKKEELDRYKQEKNKPPVPDSDVLKMLQQAKIDDKQGSGSFSKLETQLQSEVRAPPASTNKPALMLSIPSYASHVPVKALIPEGGSSVMDALKKKMKEMDISAARIDRAASVSSDDARKGRYLSTSSVESAERPKSPTSPLSPMCPSSPLSPSFKMAISSRSGVAEASGPASELMAGLKNRLQQDRVTLGLRSSRKGAVMSPKLSTLDAVFREQDRGIDENDNPVKLPKENSVVNEKAEAEEL